MVGTYGENNRRFGGHLIGNVNVHLKVRRVTSPAGDTSEAGAISCRAYSSDASEY